MKRHHRITKPLLLLAMSVSGLAVAATESRTVQWKCTPEAASTAGYFVNAEIVLYETQKLFHGEPIGGTIKTLVAEYTVDYPWVGNRNAAYPRQVAPLPSDPPGTVRYQSGGFSLAINTKNGSCAGFPGALSAAIHGQEGYPEKSLENVPVRCHPEF